MYGELFHSSDRYNAPMNISRKPIGVFDSGVGGLTVLKEMRRHLPAEDFIYLGDTARLPYGTKSPQSIARYACQAARQLQNEQIKMLVVACNTASAVALYELRAQLSPLPVIGVVEPGAMAAVAAFPVGRHLVLATAATVRLGAYRKAILGLDARADVRELACELLVSLAEEGWTDGSIAKDIVNRYLQTLTGQERSPDCVILGCTHFPILREAIAAGFDCGTRLIDSASTTAEVVGTTLAELCLAADGERTGSLRLMATDGASRFARVGGHFLGESLSADDIQLVDL
jgi:glutamate racemase